MKKNKSLTGKLKKKIKKLYSQDPSKELTRKAIAKRIKFTGSSSTIYRVIKQLENEKFLFEVKRGKYSAQVAGRKSQKSRSGGHGVYVGQVDKTRSGAGYILVNGLENDIYVPSKYLKGAMNNDTVEVVVDRIKKNGKPEGMVREIIERSVKDVVAKIYTITNRAYAYPLQDIGIKEIAIPREELNDAQEDDMVLLEIKHWPNKANQAPIATVTEILTNYENHDLSELSILTKYGFNYIFPKSIEPELKRIEKTGVNWDPEKRKDYRDVLTFTIDPADAKDFDDALSYREMDNDIVEIGVHIADVTHYLEMDSLLDKEALRRSTSVYLVGRVCPMLPETLSNDLCSLVQGEDRLTFAVTFRIDNENKILSTWIGKTVIHSDRRMAYEEAQEIIEGKSDSLKTALDRIKSFADSERADRNKKGAINFESEEVRFLLDEKKHPLDIYIKERQDAHLLVEDLMLLANRTVAKFIDKKGRGMVPLPYRVHDEPDMERVSDLALMSKLLGFDFEIENMNTIRRSFNRLYEASKKNETFKTLSQLGIRSMAKAVYTTENIGHFGLAFSHYTHFTSPIRRYADVLVHRIVYNFLEKKELLYNEGKLEAMCTHISRRERLAMDAERESIKLKQAEYLQDFVGKEFNGKISGMIDRGLFVILENSVGEGLVPFATLDEPFELHPSGFSAKGQHSGKMYAMGDRVRVRLERVDIDERQIDLTLVLNND